MNYQTTITDPSGRTVSITLAQDYWIFRDVVTGKEIINIAPPTQLELLRETVKVTPGILNCLHQDIDKIIYNNGILLKMADELKKYNSSPDYIGNEQGWEKIIDEHLAQLKQ